MLLAMGIILAFAISFGIAHARYLPDKEFFEATKLRHSFKLIAPRYEKRILVFTITLMPFIFIAEAILFLIFTL
jgi:hypothetical protein